MRVAVVSDTHMPRGTRRLPEACLERLRAADLILHGGDVTGAAFWEELSTLGPPVSGVRGNMDEPALGEVLPMTRVVAADGSRIGVVHIPGPVAGREARLTARFPGCAAVVFGHTHLPHVELVDGVWILNPGSPTERRRAPRRTMLELRIAGGEVVPELVHVGT